MTAFDTARAVFHIGPLAITQTVITTWGIMALLGLTALLSTRSLKLEPGVWQSALEGVVSAIEDAVAAVLPEHARQVLPFVATLWTFIVTANLVGVFPGLRSPTDDLSLTAALALLVFFSTHWYGIR